MDLRFMAYPFLTEESRMCDYEVASDEVASMLGYACHLVKHCPEISEMIELVYHLNGSIRGKCGIDDEDVRYWSDVYDKYRELCGNWNEFVLPQGCIGTSYLHVIRSRMKAVLRIAYAIDRKERKVDQRLLDLWNLLGNLIFLMCRYENKQEGVKEALFVSKSYGN